MRQRTARVVAWSIAAILASPAGAVHTRAQAVRAGGTNTVSPSPQPAVASARPTAAARALLDQYCVACHNERQKTADLMLDTLDLSEVAAHTDVWEKVLRKLQTGLMPPVGRPRPDAVNQARFVSWLETTIDSAAAAAPNPGRPAVHRLNRFEYENAIRDLLALEVDGRVLLPADDAGYGFDNIADVLSVSPALLERYLVAAEQISRLAIGDPAIEPETETYSLPYMTLLQDDRMSDELPAGSRGGIAIRHHFPLDGEYVIRVKLQTEPQFSAVRGLDVSEQIDVRIDGVRTRLFEMGAQAAADLALLAEQPSADADLEVRLPVKAGLRVVGVTLVRNHWYMETVGPERLPAASFGFSGGTRSGTSRGKQSMGVDKVTIDGPFNGQRPDDTASRRRIFICQPAGVADEMPCARTILSTLARRAYRRSSTDADVAKLMRYYTAGRADGDFHAGIQRALEALLVDPEFLFRIEIDPPGVLNGDIYQLSDLELASRLSFFLWSSIPDDELLDVAVEGQLRDPATLEEQVHRMLRDPRGDALLTNFFGQWLWLRNLATANPDAKEFPEFDDSLRGAFQRETELFLDSQVREDHSVLELLTADYTFVNEQLARHYGIPHVYGSHFRRVALPDDRRAGLLGQGSILTVTSYPNRTSPVVRGKWLLETLLGAPPPAPPPDVPPFPEGDGVNQSKSVRERMEQHRRNPVCAACHAQLDPLGFALENFNAVGQWRATEANAPVDASGVLPSGHAFNGPAEFRQAMLAHRDAYLTNVTETLLTYALGRGVEFFDMPAVRQIMRESESGDYRWSSLIMGIVRSAPFQMRRSES